MVLMPLYYMLPRRVRLTKVLCIVHDRRLNNIKEARQVFARACSVATTLDWPERVIDAWLMFERESGDMSTYRDALVRTRTAMKNVEALRQVSL
jgi:hypothetical protein